MPKTKASKKTVKKQTAVVTPEVKSAELPVKKSNNNILRKLLLILVIAGLLYLGRGLFLVALVNYRPITRLELVSSLEKKYAKQGVEELISKNIILSEAGKSGVKVTAKDIDAEVERIRTLVEPQGLTLEEALEAQGQSMNDLRENVRIQKLIEGLLGPKVEISDDDAKKYFDENKETFPEGTKFEDMKEDLKSSLKQQKLGTEFEKWIAEKRASSKIIYFVDFSGK